MQNHTNSPVIPPPASRKLLPIVQALVSVYKLWHESLPNLSKAQRYTIGSKIDTCFIQTIEATITASTLVKQEKIPHLDRAVSRLDLLKFFLYLAWEIKAMDTQKYILFSEKLDEIGRQLGGWKRQVQK